jgi:hypothetical protein
MPFVKSIGGKNKNSIVFVGHLIYGGKNKKNKGKK